MRRSAAVRAGITPRSAGEKRAAEKAGGAGKGAGIIPRGAGEKPRGAGRGAGVAVFAASPLRARSEISLRLNILALNTLSTYGCGISLLAKESAFDKTRE